MTDIISWDKAIDKKVKSSDDKDLEQDSKCNEGLYSNKRRNGR